MLSTYLQVLLKEANIYINFICFDRLDFDNLHINVVSHLCPQKTVQKPQFFPQKQ